jgi:hypothetical protein
LGKQVPDKYKEKMPAVGGNYKAVAAQAAATSGWTAVKMINAVKVRNLETLGADGAADLRDTFFSALALEMAKQGLARDDLKGHIKMFNDIGTGLGG